MTLDLDIQRGEFLAAGAHGGVRRPVCAQALGRAADGTASSATTVFRHAEQALRPEVAAVSTLMLLLTLGSLVVVALVLRRSGDGVASTLAGS